MYLHKHVKAAKTSIVFFYSLLVFLVPINVLLKLHFKNILFKMVHYLNSKFLNKRHWEEHKQDWKTANCHPTNSRWAHARPLFLVGGWGQRRGKSTINAKKVGEKDLLVSLQVDILITSSFACGRPPPLEASHSVLTDGAAQTMAVRDCREANFHVCSDTKQRSSVI